MSTQIRKLAAIVFTDIVGFTELSAKNEPAALELLQTQRNLLQPIVKSHNGEWLKEIGDGLLLSFRTNHEAVMCAIEIQKIVKKIDLLNLRIGIHQGEVVIQGNDVVGDDVNIASRIEPFAAEGGIAISGRINAGLERDPEFETLYIGKPKLKGVKQDVKVYCIISHGLPKTDIDKVSAKIEPEKKSLINRIILPLTGVVFTLIGAFVWFIFPLISFTTASSKDYDKKIAVLYFDNKGETSDDYISEGLTQEIITRLSKIKNLSVASRFDIAGYRSTTINLDEIKEKLDIDFLLTGFIRKLGSRLKISAELIDLDSRQISWAEIYDKNVDDIFEIQREVSLNVVNNLDIGLNTGDEEILILDPAKNNNVYDMLLKVKFNTFKLNTDSTALQKLVDELDIIIEKDSTFADALATRSFTTFLLYLGKEIRKKPNSQESKEFYDKILKDASLALYYDPNNFLATSIYPFINLMQLSQSKGSPTQMIFLGRKALVGVNEMIEKNPNHYLSQFVKGMYHQVLALLTNNISDYNEAVFYLTSSIDQTRKGVENNIADPMVKMIYNRGTWWLAELHGRFEYFSHVMSLYEELIVLHSYDNTSYRLKKTLRRKGVALVNLGYFEKSIDNYIKLNQISGSDLILGSEEISLSFYSISKLANSYIHLNQHQVAIDLLNENQPSEYYPDWNESIYYKAYEYELFLGEAYAGLNNLEKSNFHLLRSIKAIEERIEFSKNMDPNRKFAGTSIKDIINEYGRFSLIPKSLLALNKSISNNRNDVEVLIQEILDGINLYGTEDSFTNLKIISCLAKIYQNVEDQVNFKINLDKAKQIRDKISEKLIQKDKENFNLNVPSNIKLRSLFNLN